MPRGSQPGERRGGRQRGTPNKKTLLKDAAINAASASPNQTPLGFLLALMRNPDLPLAERLRLAEAAAPYVHTKPTVPRRTSENLFKTALAVRNPSTGLIFGPRTSVANVHGNGADANEGEPSPLDFLLSVMNDPKASSALRIKAARIAAPYKSARSASVSAAEALAVVNDPYGFVVDPDLASKVRDARVTSRILLSHLRDKGFEEASNRNRRESDALGTRLPDISQDYKEEDARRDGDRLQEFWRKRRSGENLTVEELAEEAHLAARVEARATQPWRRARQRIAELQANSELSAEEQREIEELQAQPIKRKITLGEAIALRKQDNKQIAEARETSVLSAGEKREPQGLQGPSDLARPETEKKRNGE
jgi:hypothetical protein